MSGIYEQAIEKFGIESQMKKTVEELTELSLAIQHYSQEKSSSNNICEELADVWIMGQQMAKIFGEDRVEEWKLKKIERLKRLVAEL